MTLSMKRTLVPLRVPARCCQLNLQLHRGKRGHWWGAGGCPVFSSLRASQLSSSSPAEPWEQQQHCAAPPATAPLFVASQSVATKTPTKAKPSTGSLVGSAGRLVGFDKLQTTRGGGGKPAKTR